MSRKSKSSRINTEKRYHNEQDQDEDEEYMTYLQPNQKDLNNREIVRRAVRAIIKSEEDDGLKEYKLMGLYDKLSYTYDLNRKTMQIMSKYEDVKEEYATCFKCIKSPITGTFWIMKVSFKVSFMIVFFIASLYVIVTILKKISLFV